MEHVFFAPKVSTTNKRARTTNDPEIRLVGGCDTASGHIKLNEAASELLLVGHGEYALIIDNSEAVAAAKASDPAKYADLKVSYYITKGSEGDDVLPNAFKVAATAKGAKEGQMGLILGGSDKVMWAKMGATKGSINKIYSISTEAIEADITGDGEDNTIYVLSFARDEEKAVRGTKGTTDEDDDEE